MGVETEGGREGKREREYEYEKDALEKPNSFSAWWRELRWGTRVGKAF